MEAPTGPYDAVLLVVDCSISLGTEVFDHLQQFVLDGCKYLPPNARIMMEQYGGLFDSRRFSDTGYYWTNDNYISAAYYTMAKHIKGLTDTAEAIYEMVNKWLATKPGRHRALMLLVTDALIGPGEEESINAVRSIGIDVRYIAVNVPEWQLEAIHMDCPGLFLSSDIIKMDSYSDAANKLWRQMRHLWYRVNYTSLADFNSAMELAPPAPGPSILAMKYFKYKGQLT